MLSSFPTIFVTLKLPTDLIAAAIREGGAMGFFKRELSPVERFENALKEKQAARQKLAGRLDCCGSGGCGKAVRCGKAGGGRRRHRKARAGRGRSAHRG